MGLSSDRRLAPKDYHLVRRTLERVTSKLQQANRKACHKLIDVDTMVTAIFQFESAFIVDDCYLVVYDIGTPWYALPGTLVLEEVIVLKLAVSGDFTVVPAFLERKAREAGCKLVVAGTALAKADAALASLYHRAGFQTETLTVTKEP